MPDRYNVLFLCTGNSARSIIAEALLNHLGEGRFRAFSAGSKPTGIVNPLAIRALDRHGTPVGEPRSKSWQEFAGHSAPEMDFVITVCDSAAGEVCPAWPGQPITAHWGISDPAAVQGNQAPLAFTRALLQLERRISLFTSLNTASLERLALQKRVRDIGLIQDESASS
jgi:arsenate reductase